jgi:hypothetical protein
MIFAGANSSVIPILISLILVNSAIGLMAPGTTSMVMSAVPPDQAGMASGTQSTTRQIGGALGVAVLGSILAIQYGSNVSKKFAGTPAEPYLATAKRSLAAALRSVPAGNPAQATVVRFSRSAYVDGMHVVASVTALAAVLCAGIVFTVLRSVIAAEPGREIVIVNSNLVATPEEP